MKKTYFIFVAPNQQAQIIKKKIIVFLKHHHFHCVTKQPQFIFSIGGDGTFLKAFQEFSTQLKNVVFIPIKAGLLGFYCTFFKKNLTNLFNLLMSSDHQFTYYQRAVLRINFGHHVRFAINEIKIVDHVKTLSTSVAINNSPLQLFRGSGIIFSTASGSTGYARSIHGAVLLSQNIWQMQELAPVANSKFSTINAPLILSQADDVILTNGLQQKWLICDTFQEVLQYDTVKVQIHHLMCRILTDGKHNYSLVERLKLIFPLNDHSHK